MAAIATRGRRPGASATLLVTLSPAVKERLNRATAGANRSAFVERAIADALELREAADPPPSAAEFALGAVDDAIALLTATRTVLRAAGARP